MAVQKTVTTAPSAASTPSDGRRRLAEEDPGDGEEPGRHVGRDRGDALARQPGRCAIARRRASARSGRPRWKVEESRPAVISAERQPEARRSRSQRSGGTMPSGAEHAEQRQQAVAGARRGGEEDDGEGGMHGFAIGGSARQEPVDPAEEAAAAGATAGASSARRAGAAGAVRARARRQVFVDRLVAQLGHQVVAAALGDQLRDRGIGIAEIAEMARRGRAGRRRRPARGRLGRRSRCRCGRCRACISSSRRHRRRTRARRRGRPRSTACSRCRCPRRPARCRPRRACRRRRSGRP